MPTESSSKKNVLVTGGAGFIGSHLCEQLLSDSRVICIDNLSNSSTANIEHLLGHPDFLFLKHNVTMPLELEQIPELERFKLGVLGIKEIFHLACPMSVQQFGEQRTAMMLANSYGTKVTLDWAVKYKARYVLASSSVVYGQKMSDAAVPETQVGTIDHLLPRAAYDESKRFAETLTQIYAEQHGVDARIARIFRTYGPRLKLFDAQVINDFVVSAIDGEDMVIYGDETFATTLLYVTDCVSALIKLARVAGLVGPVNIGGDEEFKLTDVAARVNKIAASSCALRYEAPLVFLSEHPVPDISLAKKALGWMPLTRLDNGLERMVDYVTANRHRLTYSV